MAFAWYLGMDSFKGQSGMQSEIMAMLMPEDSPGAALLVRRADGRIAFERIDARVACAARAAAKWLRDECASGDESACALVDFEV